MPGRQLNFPKFVMHRWRQEGDLTDIQEFSLLGTYQTAYSRLQSSDRAIEDASFVRLKNISIAWSIPSRLLSKVHIEQFKLFVQARNLLKITDYRGLDPETRYAVLPPLRVITAGFQLTL
jgi:hypothetical protein